MNLSTQYLNTEVKSPFFKFNNQVLGFEKILDFFNNEQRLYIAYKSFIKNKKKKILSLLPQ